MEIFFSTKRTVVPKSYENKTVELSMKIMLPIDTKVSLNDSDEAIDLQKLKMFKISSTYIDTLTSYITDTVNKEVEDRVDLLPTNTVNTKTDSEFAIAKQHQKELLNTIRSRLKDDQIREFKEAFLKAVDNKTLDKINTYEELEKLKQFTNQYIELLK